jgi:hypothetical protein
VAGGARLGELALKRAIQQRKLVLNRHRARAPDGVGRPHQFAHPEGRLVAQAPVLDFALRVGWRRGIYCLLELGGCMVRFVSLQHTTLLVRQPG